MTCEELQAVLLTLPSAEFDDHAVHLSRCPACAAFAMHALAAEEAFRDLETPMSLTFDAAWSENLAAEPTPSRWRLDGALVAAAAIAVVGFGLYTALADRTLDPQPAPETQSSLVPDASDSRVPVRSVTPGPPSAPFVAGVDAEWRDLVLREAWIPSAEQARDWFGDDPAVQRYAEVVKIAAAGAASPDLIPVWTSDSFVKGSSDTQAAVVLEAYATLAFARLGLRVDCNPELSAAACSSFREGLKETHFPKYAGEARAGALQLSALDTDGVSEPWAVHVRATLASMQAETPQLLR